MLLHILCVLGFELMFKFQNFDFISNYPFSFLSFLFWAACSFLLSLSPAAQHLTPPAQSPLPRPSSLSSAQQSPAPAQLAASLPSLTATWAPLVSVDSHLPFFLLPPLSFQRVTPFLSCATPSFPCMPRPRIRVELGLSRRRLRPYIRPPPPVLYASAQTLASTFPSAAVASLQARSAAAMASHHLELRSKLHAPVRLPAKSPPCDNLPSPPARSRRRISRRRVLRHHDRCVSPYANLLIVCAALASCSQCKPHAKPSPGAPYRPTPAGRRRSPASPRRAPLPPAAATVGSGSNDLQQVNRVTYRSTAQRCFSFAFKPSCASLLHLSPRVFRKSTSSPI